MAINHEKNKIGVVSLILSALFVIIGLVTIILGTVGILGLLGAGIGGATCIIIGVEFLTVALIKNEPMKPTETVAKLEKKE